MKNFLQSSPATVLHEGAHAENDLTNRAQLRIDLNTQDKNFGNVEEKNAIVNVETPAAIKLGEPVRNNHAGTPKQVSCATCDK